MSDVRDEKKAPTNVAAVRAVHGAKPCVMDRVFQQLLRVPPSKTLDHLVRFLGTWTGTDKVRG